MYGGEGCREKRKVVCYPAGGGGRASSQRLRGAGRLTRAPPPPHSNRCSTTFLPRWPAQGPPSYIFEPAAKAPLQLLLNETLIKEELSLIYSKFLLIMKSHPIVPLPPPPPRAMEIICKYSIQR